MLNSLRAQNIDIKTQGTTYVAGETVKGIFTLAANKGFKTRDISVSVYGKEKTAISTTKNIRYVSLTLNLNINKESI